MYAKKVLFFIHDAHMFVLKKHLYYYDLICSLPRVTYVWHSGLFRESGVTHVWHCWSFIYVYKLITNYLFINCWLPVLLIVIDYLYICFICIQVNMCDILRKRKACCKKGQSEDFSNLIVITNVLIMLGCLKTF